MNPQLDIARRYVEQTGVSLFLTGKAGTGKTTFLRSIDASCPKRHVVLAPTGVAAVNAGGVTIHSFFQLPFEPYLPDVPELVTEYQLPRRKGLNKTKLNIIRTLELLIIDEISMVRADLLDAVDAALRRYRRSEKPFGGVQLLMIGDVHQLAPVVTDRERPYITQVYPSPYFFSSKALQRMHYVTIELSHIYRQQDASFVSLLNKVRDSHIDAATLAALNSRVGRPPKDAITLTTHNRQADAINNNHMEALWGEERQFEAQVEGNFPEASAPVDKSLTLKIGERVMFLKNDSSGQHRYYNGKLATVTGFAVQEGGHPVRVEVTDDDGDVILVGRERWENMKYTIGKDNEIVQSVDGAFEQYPLRAAWAVTIHKAQGLTFDRVAVNAADAFAFGQVYVALSRCRTLEGLTLTAPLSAGVAFDDTSVSAFVSAQPPFDQTAAEVEQYEQQYYFMQLLDLFSLDGLLHEGRSLERQYFDFLKNIYPKEVSAMQAMMQTLVELSSVSERFRSQLQRLPRAQHADRIAKATAYFLPQLSTMSAALPALLEVEIDNKEHARAVSDRGGQFADSLAVKVASLRVVKEKGFSVVAVQKARTDVLLDKGTKKEKSRKSENGVPRAENMPMARLLRDWRLEKAREAGHPPYTVLTQKALTGIVAAMPRSERELLAVKGVGKVIVQKYGKEILDLVADFREAYGV